VAVWKRRKKAAARHAGVVEDCKERRKTGSGEEDLTAGCHHSSVGHCHRFFAAA
jgi:hypothetical protein